MENSEKWDKKSRIIKHLDEKVSLSAKLRLPVALV